MEFDFIDDETIKLLYSQYVKNKNLNLEQKMVLEISRTYSKNEAIGVLIGEYQRVVKMLRSMLLRSREQRVLIGKMKNADRKNQKFSKLIEGYTPKEIISILESQEDAISKLKATITSHQKTIEIRNAKIKELEREVSNLLDRIY